MIQTTTTTTTSKTLLRHFILWIENWAGGGVNCCYVSVLTNDYFVTCSCVRDSVQLNPSSLLAICVRISVQLNPSSFVAVSAVQFSSIQEDTQALGNVRTRNSPSLRGITTVTFETVLMLFLIDDRLSRPFRIDRRALFLCTPFSFRRPTAWYSWLCQHTESPAPPCFAIFRGASRV